MSRYDFEQHAILNKEYGPSALTLNILFLLFRLLLPFRFSSSLFLFILGVRVGVEGDFEETEYCMNSTEVLTCQDSL